MSDLPEIIRLITAPQCLASMATGVAFGAAWSYFFNRRSFEKKTPEPMFAVPIEERFEVCLFMFVFGTDL